MGMASQFFGFCWIPKAIRPATVRTHNVKRGANFKKTDSLNDGEGR